jgi:hypothetical protein
MVEAIKTIIASKNNVPPSPFTLVPITSKWEKMAPIIMHILNTIPYILVFGMSIKNAVMSSVIPKPILPYGSKPKAENI